MSTCRKRPLVFSLSQISEVAQWLIWWVQIQYVMSFSFKLLRTDKILIMQHSGSFLVYCASIMLKLFPLQSLEHRKYYYFFLSYCWYRGNKLCATLLCKSAYFKILNKWTVSFAISPDHTPAHHLLLRLNDAHSHTPLEVKEPVDVGWPPFTRSLPSFLFSHRSTLTSALLLAPLSE